MPDSVRCPSALIEHLTERRLGVGGLLADHGVVDRDVAPAEHLQTLAGGDLLHAGASRLLRLRVPRQEPDAGGVGARRRQNHAGDRTQEGIGHLDEDPGAVAHVHLGVGGPQ